MTNQKNFYKHIESLRDEFGCDIEMADTHGEQSYRLRSQARKKPKSKPKPKITLEDSQKEALLMFSGYACQVCGAKMIPGEIDLQADQKIPSKKGGGQELNNWQIICNECNFNKKRVCAQCSNNCSECSWAFPEHADHLTLIRVPGELYQQLKNIGLSNQNNLEKYIIDSLKHSLTTVRNS